MTLEPIFSEGLRKRYDELTELVSPASDDRLIIWDKSANSLFYVNFSTFAASVSIAHNSTTSIQDAPNAVANEHYHLNSAQATVVSSYTTVGSSFFSLVNPSAITFPRINADNTVTARSAANYRQDLGVNTANDAVTSSRLYPVFANGVGSPPAKVNTTYLFFTPSTGLFEANSFATPKARITPEGGFAILLTNKTGANSVKGECVRSNSAQNNSVIKTTDGIPDCIGVFYESGIADGSEAWIVCSGIADVYFIGSTTRGHVARTFISGETGYVTGKALSEAVPSSPFASDKHFCEIGHVLETRTGAGLAKCVLHFN